MTGRLAWYDAAVLGGLFAAYLWRIRGSEESEEDLIGVAATVAAQPRIRRRALVVLLFVAAAVVILSAAEPFGESLVEAGSELGIDRFLLVQWLAPIASSLPRCWPPSRSRCGPALTTAWVRCWPPSSTSGLC